MNRLRRILGGVGTAGEGPLFLVNSLLRSAVILVYHRVAPDPDPFYPPTSPTVFRQHLELIKRHFTIVELQEVVERLNRNLSLRRCCAITFDDGFGDFLTHAYPILVELEVPVTHFLTLEALLSGRPTWNYRLSRALHSLQLSTDLRHSQRAQGSPTMAELMRAKSLVDRLSAHERTRLLERMEAVTQPPSDPPMLRPPDLQTVDPALVQWESHTVTHSTLTGRGVGELRYELADSRSELERVLGKSVRFLAYPNGEADGSAAHAAAECGYTASFLCGQRRVRPATPLHCMPRFDVGALPADMLGLELIGVTPSARRMLRGDLIRSSQRMAAARFR